VSGVTASDLTKEKGAKSFEEVQKALLDLLGPHTILIGHSLFFDLKTLRLKHEKVVDTSFLFRVKDNEMRKHSLRSLARLVLHDKEDDDSPHCSVLDAQLARRLALFEALRHPKKTEPMPAEVCPRELHLSGLPQDTSAAAIAKIIGGASGALQIGKCHFQLTEELKWVGQVTIKFPSQKKRDEVFDSMSNYVTMSVGPLSKWASSDLSTEDKQDYVRKHFSTFGKIGKVKITYPKKQQTNGKPIPSALLEVDPAAAGKIMGLNGAKGRVYSHQDFLGNLPVRLEPVQYDPGKKLARKVVPYDGGPIMAERKI